MSSLRFAWPALAVLALLLMAVDARAAEPVFVAPAGWLEAAPAGQRPCKGKMTSQVTHADYRRFALRNQVWPQEVIEESDWKGGGVVKQPALWRSAAAHAKRGPILVEVHVLIGGEGEILDKIVVCSNSPEFNSDYMLVTREFMYKPARYKGRGLVTVVPIVFKM